jgi:hypothetical protein
MNIWLVDIDSTIPNLALMKLASYHIGKGDTVELVRNVRISSTGISYRESRLKGRYVSPDKIYISCIFSWNRQRCDQFNHLDVPIIKGGSGYNTTIGLDPEVDKCDPHIDLYDKDWVVGYSHRGCIRTCDFCVVPQESLRMYGRKGIQRNETTIKEMLDPFPDIKRVQLLDNNFLAKPNAVEEMEWCTENNIEVNFNQGLDIRLISPSVGRKRANALAKVRYRSKTFKSSKVNFAYDHVGIADHVEKGIANLQKAGINTRSDVQFYVLVGFNSTFEDDVARINHLRSLNTSPFVMIYRQPNKGFSKGTPHPFHKKLARWANGKRLYWSTSFERYMGSLHPDQVKLEAFAV